MNKHRSLVFLLVFLAEHAPFPPYSLKPCTQRRSSKVFATSCIVDNSTEMLRVADTNKCGLRAMDVIQLQQIKATRNQR